MAGSRTGNAVDAATYESPMDYSCQKTFIVYLTDGLPTKDTQSNADIQALLTSPPMASSPPPTAVAAKW